MGILAKYDAKVLDIGQADIHSTLSLGILIRMDEMKSGLAMKELLFKATELGVNIGFSPISDDEYEDWVEETGVKLYAISIDDAKTSARVAPFVKGKGWEYTVLLDVNSDFKRAMNVNDVPYMCILNGDGEIVWQHTSYAPGSEEEVYEIIKSLVEK